MILFQECGVNLDFFRSIFNYTAMRTIFYGRRVPSRIFLSCPAMRTKFYGRWVQSRIFLSCQREKIQINTCLPNSNKLEDSSTIEHIAKKSLPNQDVRHLQRSHKNEILEDNRIGVCLNVQHLKTSIPPPFSAILSLKLIKKTCYSLS